MEGTYAGEPIILAFKGKLIPRVIFISEIPLDREPIWKYIGEKPIKKFLISHRIWSDVIN